MCSNPVAVPYLLCVCDEESSEFLINECSFTDHFEDINHGYREVILKKSSAWLLLFIWLWLLMSIMKRCTERCALQLYHTSLM